MIITYMLLTPMMMHPWMKFMIRILMMSMLIIMIMMIILGMIMIVRMISMSVHVMHGSTLVYISLYMYTHIEISKIVLFDKSGNSGFRIQNPELEFRIQNLDSEFRIQNSRGADHPRGSTVFYRFLSFFIGI